MISVVIPVYNVEKYIKRCIDSVLNQTLQDFEIIIVNDCTPDNSIKIIESKYKDPRIKIINNESNKGLVYTRKAGYTHISGEYIVFLDSDDWLPDNALEVLYNSISKSNSDIVISNYTHVFNNGRCIKNEYTVTNWNDKWDKNGLYKSLLSGEIHPTLCAKIYKSSLFKEYTYKTFDNITNAEDSFLTYQIVNNIKRYSVISNSTYNYYYNRESSSRKSLTEQQIEQQLFVTRYIYQMLDINTELKSELNKYTISFLISLINKKIKLNLIQNYFPNLDMIFRLKNIRNAFPLKIALFYYLKYKIFIFNNQ